MNRSRLTKFESLVRCRLVWRMNSKTLLLPCTVTATPADLKLDEGGLAPLHRSLNEVAQSFRDGHLVSHICTPQPLVLAQFASELLAECQLN